MIDLHFHSTYSDGLHNITQLHDLALHNGLRTIALTDHDTVAGVEELRQCCQQSGIGCIAGIELSTRWKKHDIHIIGLNMDTTHPALVHAIEQQEHCRLQRAQKIAEKLEQLGFKEVWSAVRQLAGHQHIARPHFAQLLLNAGWVRDFQAAFSQYLARGKLAYVETEWMTVSEAVHCIQSSGGIAVVAHPLKYKLTRRKLCELIEHFQEAGGQAMEMVSGEMSTQQIREVLNLCQKYQLYASTGSDFHGQGRSRIGLGKQHSLPPDCKPVWTLWE
ncbi:MAG: PHP domain-containing protein [Legionellaceae bacterium]|nr:PHP domain-containing protein [Legionellaceae bacterium]